MQPFDRIEPWPETFLVSLKGTTSETQRFQNVMKTLQTPGGARLCRAFNLIRAWALPSKQCSFGPAKSGNALDVRSCRSSRLAIPAFVSARQAPTRTASVEAPAEAYRRIKPIFVNHPLGLTVGEIATLTGAELRTGARLDDRITSVAQLDMAGASDLAFLDTAKFADALPSTRAGACLVSERFESRAPSGLNVLRAREPYRAFVAVARHLFETALRPSSPFETSGVDPAARVHPSARLECGAIIDPGAVVGPRAVIGARTVIGATAVIGPDVQIGRDCSIGPGSTIVHALIGDNVICHPGCRIGQDGFRYLPGKNGHVKVPQIGRVIIQDDVEIGAGSTIDRGGMGDTFIGEGTKIDNLVHIAHNVRVGRHCIIAGQCGLAGSVTLGDHVMLGGQVGVADHLTVGSGAMIGAKSGVVSDVPAGEKWLGYPAWPGRAFLRGMTALRKLTADGKKNGR